MSVAKRIIIWVLILGAIGVVAVNFKTIRDKVVGFNENAAYMREAKEAGSKIMADVFTNWNYDAFQNCLDDSVKSSWADKAQQFSIWNGTYGSQTQHRAKVEMKQTGDKADFEYRAEMHCAYKDALLVITMRRKAENDWKVINVSVSDLPASAAKFD